MSTKSLDPLLRISKKFRVTNEEYAELDRRFGKLALKQSWTFDKRNSGFCIDSQPDIVQELAIALMTAGGYYKRQVYIESCLSMLKTAVDDPLIKNIVDRLEFLWSNKTKHGAGKRTFGEWQEQLLGVLVREYIPKSIRPSKSIGLKFDEKFSRYCKSITWNRVKNIGMRETREKRFRVNEVSLSDFNSI
jgi:hypothetical protein